MSPLTQSRAVDDAPSEDERQEEELPSHVAALGSASRAHLTAASYSKHPSLTPSSHSSANLIAGIITCFNKQISDGKEHEMFFFFFTSNSIKEEELSMNSQQGINKSKSQ